MQSVVRHPVGLLHLVLDHLQQVAVGTAHGVARLVDDRRREDHGVARCAGEPARVDHRVQHDVPAGLGLGRAHRRVPVVGRRDDAREKCGLLDRQVGGGDAEVGLRGGVDPVRVAAVVDGVEVVAHDRGLRLRLRDLDREKCLVRLAHVARRRRADQVPLDVLLRQRGATLGPAALEVVDQRACHALDGDAGAAGVERLVLCGRRRLPDVGRQRGVVDDRALLVGKGAHHGAGRTVVVRSEVDGGRLYGRVRRGVRDLGARVRGHDGAGAQERRRRGSCRRRRATTAASGADRGTRCGGSRRISSSCPSGASTRGVRCACSERARPSGSCLPKRCLPSDVTGRGHVRSPVLSGQTSAVADQYGGTSWAEPGTSALVADLHTITTACAKAGRRSAVRTWRGSPAGHVTCSVRSTRHTVRMYRVDTSKPSPA